MKKTLFRALLGVTALTLFVPAFAQSQPKPEAKPAAGASHEKKAPEMDPKEKAAMEAMMKAGQPGPHHELLAGMAGQWKAVVKSWMAPGQPPTLTEGSSANAMVMGGRYLEERFQGSFMEMPFEGLGYTAYDNVLQKYVGTWIDSMSTGIMTSVGTPDASGKVITSTGSFTDPVQGKTVTSRMVLKILSKDAHTMEMYGKGPDGREFLMMEITYTRAKK